MSPSSAAAFDRAPTIDTSADHGPPDAARHTWAEDKSPTRPLPRLSLEDAVRRLDQAFAAEDATVTVSPEQNKELLASAFADAPPGPLGDASDHAYNTDDEPTLDAPAPASSPEVLAALSFPRTAPALVMSMPAPVPASFDPPPSGVRRKITPQDVQTARDLRMAAERRRKDATLAIRLPKLKTETYVVAGIWATALGLFAALLFMVTSA